jgi:predicted acyltransferase
MKPLVIMGMNAITVYLVSELLEVLLNAVHSSSGGHTITVREWLFQTLFAPLASPVNASLLYAIAYTLLMYAVAYVMYRRRWFVRV